LAAFARLRRGLWLMARRPQVYVDHAWLDCLQRVSFDEGGGPLTGVDYLPSIAGRKKWWAMSREVGRVLLLMVIENHWWCAMVHAMTCLSVMLRVDAGYGLNANPVTSMTGNLVVF